MPAWSMGRTLKVSLLDKKEKKYENRISITYPFMEVCSIDFTGCLSWALIAGFYLNPTATALPFLTKIFSPVQTLVFLKFASD